MFYTQDDRLLAIDTPLGKDVLLLSGFSGEEGVSRLFYFDLLLLSENNNIAFEDIVGQNATVSMGLADGSRRVFNGIISEFGLGQGGDGDGGGIDLTGYSATMVPWPWLLTRSADSRIFQNMAVPEIIEQVLTDQGFADYRLLLQPGYRKREYCTQYRETHFDFISRLMEEEGIYYFFTHEAGRHVLVLADANTAHQACPGQESARMRLSSGGNPAEDKIAELQKSKKIRTSKYSLNDYNFKMPDTDLKVSVNSYERLGPGERERYDSPGRYDTRTDGDHLARMRIEAQEARLTTIGGSSDCRGFAAGYRFKLLDHHREDMNEKEFLLVSVGHNAWQGGYRSGDSGDSDASYSNYFVCIPHEVQYRPRLETPRPVLHGAQTAMVVGPPGEEIYTDAHGRVKVQFHWDRVGSRDDTSSCWIRVGQVWAGAGWGGMFIPRIGQEVIVAFLEGNPDRPIITGCVYHGNNRPPYVLPDEKTKSTLKSNSSPGGGGYNEIRFEDQAGAEEIYIHGQRDMNIVVENDQKLVVHQNRNVIVDLDNTQQVGKDQSHTVAGNRDVTVAGSDTESVNGSQSVTVGGAQSVTVGGTRTVTVKSGQTVTISAAQSVFVAGNETQTVGGSKSETVGGQQATTIGGPFTLTCAGLTVISSGPVSITAPSIALNTPVVTVSGVIQCATLVTNSVVSPSYTPGAGNLV